MGWNGESQRHALSSRGIPTTRRLKTGGIRDLDWIRKFQRQFATIGKIILKRNIAEYKLDLWDIDDVGNYITKMLHNNNLIVELDIKTRNYIITEIQPFRKPDNSVSLVYGDWAVWYGPGGEHGDTATEVDGDVVREYINVSGFFEYYDEDNPIMVSEVYVGDIWAKSPEHYAQIGVNRLAEYGPDEQQKFVGELPK